jgi:hypothetical protein
MEQVYRYFDRKIGGGSAAVGGWRG